MADRHWFQISPKNDAARAIVNDTRNRECVIPSPDGRNRIIVTFDDYFRPDCILSFGRDRACSVVCDPPGLPEPLSRQFSRRQCQFFLEKNTLMLRDDSSGSTTSIHPRQIDSNLWEFPSKSTGTPRQRAVLERGDWDLAMGPAEYLLQFSDRDGWWNRYAKEKKVLATRKLPADCMLTLPTMSLPPTRYQTRVQTPRIPENKIRDSVTYHELEYLGKGSFGRVSRVIDLQWGGIMAVKIINVEREKEKETKETLKREVELLAKLSHPHIIEYRHSQGWEFGEPIEIFMSAADGSLRGFLEDRRSHHTKMTNEQITHVSRHITSALHYLHGEKILHRDIKPENILFKDIFTNPIFSLADFGFSKEIDSKATFVGTPLYWAPEVCSGAPQDFRVDIWSLGVVIYEMLTGLALDQLPDLTKRVCISGEWCKRLDRACRGGGDLAKMVTLNVEKRITIDMCYESSTFPVLPDALPSPVAQIPAQAPPSLTSRTTLKHQPRGQKSGNILAGAAQYRVEKAQGPLQAQPVRRLRGMRPRQAQT